MQDGPGRWCFCPGTDSVRRWVSTCWQTQNLTQTRRRESKWCTRIGWWSFHYSWHWWGFCIILRLKYCSFREVSNKAKSKNESKIISGIGRRVREHTLRCEEEVSAHADFNLKVNCATHQMRITCPTSHSSPCLSPLFPMVTISIHTWCFSFQFQKLFLCAFFPCQLPSHFFAPLWLNSPKDLSCGLQVLLPYFLLSPLMPSFCLKYFIRTALVKLPVTSTCLDLLNHSQVSSYLSPVMFLTQFGHSFLLNTLPLPSRIPRFNFILLSEVRQREINIIWYHSYLIFELI